MIDENEEHTDLSALKSLLLQPELQSLRELDSRVDLLEQKLLNDKVNTDYFSHIIAKTLESSIHDDELNEVLHQRIYAELKNIIESKPELIVKALIAAYGTQKLNN
jgi:hypothetical protein